MDLHTAGHRRGVVCAPHRAAAEAGRAILAEGGNALEAMVAMAATIAAVYPHMNHIGGDGFWLIREPSGRVRALMAAGPAGARATPALYREHGHDDDPDARAARRAHGAGRDRRLDAGARGREGAGRQAAARRCCSAPASAMPATATPVTRSQARLSAGEARPSSRTCPVLPRRSCPTASRRRPATTLTQAALAATLDHLAHAGLDDFYRGDVGARDRRRSRAHRQPGHARRSRQAFAPRVAEPLRVDAARPARSTTRRRRPRGSPR